MALLADFICETANSPGSATVVNLVGASNPSFVTFASRYTSGSQVYYTISDESSARESGIGTFTAGSPNTLSRTTVLSNTLGTNSRLNFLGSVLVYNSIPAAKALFLDVNGNVSGLTTLGVSGVLTAGSVVSTGTISLNNQTPLQAKDNGGTYRSLAYIGSDNWTNIASANSGTGVRVLNSTQSSAVFTVTNAGALDVLGTVTLHGSASATGSGWALIPTGTTSVPSQSIFYALITNNNIVALGFYAASDERIKSDIMPIEEAEALQWVKTSRPVTFRKRQNYNSPESDAVHSAGFIAQDQVRAGFGKYVGTVPSEGMPERIDPDGFRSLPDYQLTLNPEYQIAYLTAALQSALSRIEALEAKLNP